MYETLDHNLDELSDNFFLSRRNLIKYTLENYQVENFSKNINKLFFFFFYVVNNTQVDDDY